MTTFSTVRGALLLRVPGKRMHMLQQNPKLTNRVMAVLVSNTLRRGARKAVASEQSIMREAMTRFGISTKMPIWIASLLMPLVMDLLKTLLPILIAWIKEQLDDLDVDNLFSASADLNVRFSRIAEEAEREAA